MTVLSSDLRKMPVDLPVFFLSGAEDPVGDYGKSVEKVYQSFLAIGMNVFRSQHCQNCHAKQDEQNKHAKPSSPPM